MIRIWLVIAGIACGVLLATVAPGLIGSMRAQLAALPGMTWLQAEAVEPTVEPHGQGHSHHDEEDAIKLSDQQIAAADPELPPLRDVFASYGSWKAARRHAAE